MLRTPLLVRRSPVFYGFIVWIVATVGIIATSPGQSFSVSIFIDDFIREFQLDRTTVSGLYGLGTFLAALSLTWVGRQIDKRGNRRVGIIVSALFAVVLILFSTITSPIFLLFGFMAIRGLGQGSLMIINSTVIAQWFKRYRGRMMSLAIVAFALFQGAYVDSLRLLNESIGWRQSWIVLGIGIAMTVLPLTVIFMRNRPEDFGLQPDGDLAPKEEQQVTIDKPKREYNATLREAMNTPIFWVFMFAKFLPSAWGTGLVLHQISLFDGLGYTPAIATQTFAWIALCSAMFSILAGILIDKISPKYVVALQLLAFLVMVSFGTMMTQTWMLIIYAIGFGFVLGAGGVFDGAVYPNLYGRLHQGAIRGFTSTVAVIGSAVGPILFGISFDSWGGYATVLYIGVGLAMLAIIASLWVKEPVQTAMT